MKKIITLHCPECGNNYSFAIGADSSLTSLREISALIPDKKDADKINEIYLKLAETHDKSYMSEFARNPAEALNHVCYSALGEQTVNLFDEENEENGDLTQLFGEKAKEAVDASMAKWQAALNKEGVLALSALYICPKTHTPVQGTHISVRYKDAMGAPAVYVCKNKCPDCSSAPVLADDLNAGFMHETLTTTARCKNCSAKLEVGAVSFKQPVKEQPEN